MISRTVCLHLGRVLFSVSLFAVVLVYIDWSELISTFKRVDLFWIVINISVLLMERLLAVYKWNMLLTVKKMYVPFWSLFMIVIIGRFWGLFLPSSVSTDIVRSYYLYKATSSGALSAASVFVDKIMGVGSLLLIGTIGIVFYPSQFTETEITAYIVGLVVVSGIGIYVLQREDLASYLASRMSTLVGNKISRVIVDVHRSFLDYKQFPIVLLSSFLLSLLFQFLRVGAVYTLALALSVDVPFVFCVIILPIVMILIMIPVSIGGFGVREGIFVGFFALAGLSTTDAFAIAFASSILDTLVSLLGGVAYLFGWSTQPIRNGAGPQARQQR